MDADRRYCDHPERFLAGHEVRILRDGEEAFPEMLGAIESARHSVHLETYILAADRTGDKFAAALAERARAGCTVRLLYDAIGATGITAQWLRPLLDAGVQVREYGSLWPWRPGWAWNRRDHRKLLTVDGYVGFTGGINIADDYAPVEWGGGGWRDTHLRYAGPIVAELDELFRATWQAAGGRSFVVPPYDRAVRPGGAYMHAMGNAGFRHRNSVRRAYLHAIHRAEQSVDIANAYFVPGRPVRYSLLGARARGVRVRVLLSAHSDILAVYYASRAVWAGLMKGGVEIWEWPDRVLHAKTAVVDGAWFTCGSFNLDHRSMVHNLELNVSALDRGVGAAAHEMFERDLQAARRVDPAQWAARPIGRRLLERFFYAFRYWL